MIRISLSVVEKLHARNRRAADPNVSWGGFSSAFINQDVRELCDKRNAVEKSSSGSGASDAVRAVDDGPEALQVPSASGPKNQETAIHIYRKNWLKTQRALSFKPHAIRSWPDVHAAWDGLTDEEKATYQELSDSSKGVARQVRKALKRNDKDPSVVAPQVVAIIEPAQQSSQSGHSLWPRDLSRCLDSNGALLQELEKSEAQPDIPSLATRVDVAHLPNNTAQDVEPFSSDILQKVFSRHHSLSAGLTWAGASDRFTAEAEHVELSADFPSEVQFNLHCGHLCARDTPAQTIAMQKRLVQDWDKLAKTVSPKGKANLVATADLVVSCEVFRGMTDEKPAKVYLACLTSALGKYYRFSPVQMFAPMKAQNRSEELQSQVRCSFLSMSETSTHASIRKHVWSDTDRLCEASPRKYVVLATTHAPSSLHTYHTRTSSTCP
jgi:hypothetical protein